MTKVGLYAIGPSTTLESNKSLQGQGETHEDPAWGAYRVLCKTSQYMYPLL
jgi:hypothetical protein